jgi:hypothetical protein
MKKLSNKSIDKLTSKILKENLEEKANKLVSKIQNLQELGGMEDEHDIFGEMTPEQLEFIGKLNDDELRTFLAQKRRGAEEEDEEEENERWNPPSPDEEEYDEEEYDEEERWNPPSLDEEEIDEGFDDESMKDFRMGKDYDRREFKRNVPLGKVDYSDITHKRSGITPEKYVSDEMMDALLKALKRKNREEEQGDDFEDELTEGDGETCECGGMMKEGECSECGYKMNENLYEIEIDDIENEFDYIEGDKGHSFKDESAQRNMCEKLSPEELADRKSCSGYANRKKSGEMTEKLHGGQRKLDRNKNNRIDSEDFKMLRSMRNKKTETKEGKKFPDLSGDGKVTRKDILMGRGVKLKGKKSVKESLQLSEEEIIDLIENIVLEDKKLKSIGKVKGLDVYNKAHKGSGKENEDYLKSVTKKMKDYLKDGSKGDFEMNPKHFPKGNGALGKMKDAKKYNMSDDGNEFIDTYMRPGMENLSYDEIHPEEEWMKDTIEGSSKTGNNPKWANAEETELNKKINKKRKENKLAKVKQAAYRKSKQPITDGAGDSSGDGLDIKLESTGKQEKMLNEEFERMKGLISYDRKTQ